MFLHPSKVLDHLSVRRGHRVGDFGAGRGEYTFLLSPTVSEEGAVYAFDVVPDVTLRLYKERTRGVFNNVYTLCVDLNESIPLKNEIFDRAVVANTLYALSNRDRFLNELHRTLAPTGSVLFVDWLSSFRNMGPREEEVIGPTQAVQLFRAHGFHVGNMVPAGTHHFAFIATKQ